MLEEQSRTVSSDCWMVLDEIVIGLALSAPFCGMWKHRAKRRSGKGMDVQHREDAVWWAVMHMLDK